MPRTTFTRPPVASARFRNASLTAPQNPQSKLAGRHILIAEDEMLIAFALADMLTALGCTSMTAGRVAKAVLLAANERFDAAIVDMNLAGEPGYPIADALTGRGVPFIIATGYGVEGIAANYQYRPILAKPYLPQQIEAALLKVFQQRLRRIHRSLSIGS